MELQKLIVLNLKRRPDKKYAYIGALNVTDTPPECVEFFEARDGAAFESKEALIDAARQEIPEIWERIPYGITLGTGTLATMWSYHAILQQIASMPADECAAWTSDDFCIRQTWGLYKQAVDLLSKYGDAPFELLQLIHTKTPTRPRPTDFPRPLPFAVHLHLSYGFGGMGDWGFIASPRGAQRLLDHVANSRHISVLEWHIYLLSFEKPLPGTYSVNEPAFWLNGSIDLEAFTGKPDSNRVTEDETFE